MMFCLRHEYIDIAVSGLGYDDPLTFSSESPPFPNSLKILRLTTPASLYSQRSGKTMRSVTNLIIRTMTNLQKRGTVKRTVLVIPLASSSSSFVVSDGACTSFDASVSSGSTGSSVENKLEFSSLFRPPNSLDDVIAVL